MVVKPAFKTIKVSIIAALFIFVFFFLSAGLVVGSFIMLAFYSNPQTPSKNKEPLYSIFNSQPPVLGIMNSNVSSKDGRAAILTQFFARYKAPLAAYGKELVEAADKYGLDWRLLPAIAMLESNGGKKIPEGSYNPFGWAIHSQYTKKFSSWEEGIQTVAKGIKEDYIDRGLVTPCEIMTRYNPISTARDGSWCKAVEYFIWEIDNF